MHGWEKGNAHAGAQHECQYLLRPLALGPLRAAKERQDELLYSTLHRFCRGNGGVSPWGVDAGAWAPPERLCAAGQDLVNKIIIYFSAWANKI